MFIFNRRERRRQPDHRVVVRTGVHAESVQLVRVSQPPRRWRRRRTPSDAAYELNSDQPAARTHTDRLHGRPDESHVGRLLPTSANASSVLHVVLTRGPDRTTTKTRFVSTSHTHTLFFFYSRSRQDSARSRFI